MTNEEIIHKRPQFVVDNSKQAKKSFTVRLLPYCDYEIEKVSENSDENCITFKYSDEIYSDSFWDKYSVTIKNIGGLCRDGYLHLQDKSRVNIYHDFEFNNKIMFFYSEKVGFTQIIESGETFEIVICYPKSKPSLKLIPLDLFMSDIYGNCWHQEEINSRSRNDSYSISFEEYFMFYNEKIMQWWVLDRLYYEIKNPIYHNAKVTELLARKMQECRIKLTEFDQYRRDVNVGKILLKG